MAAASAALIVAELGLFETFGPGLAAAVLLALAVAVTFVPAALAILGDRVFWPRRPGRDVPAERAAEETPAEATGRPVRSRALRLASRHPAPAALACSAALLVAASGLLEIRVGQTLIRGLPSESETHQAYVQASRGFAPGLLSPTRMLVEAPGVVARRNALVRLQRGLDRLPGTALVVGPAQQPLDVEAGAVYSRTRNAVRYLIVFDADPLGAGAIRYLNNLGARIDGLAAAAGLPGVRTSIAGDTALAEETVRLTGEDLGRVAVGGARAASAITVAGIVLALPFAVLALVPVRPFRELAFLMSVGLLIDAFLVRTLLVPSLIALVGPVGAWPGRLLATAAAPPPVPAAPAVAVAPQRGGIVMKLVGLAIAVSVLERLRR